MRILAFDTSNRTMSVALTEDKSVLAEKTINIKRNHSIQLMPTIEELVENLGWTINEIDRIAVAEGPGSYTGVRIAVSIAKTLAWTLDCELVGVSSLKVLAGNAAYAKGHLVVPLFDARRENIYTGLYRVEKNGKLANIEPDTHISSKEWASFLKTFNEPIFFVGEDALKFENLFKETLGGYFNYISYDSQLPKASNLAKLSEDESPADIHSFVPEYLKLTEAEEKWRAKHGDEEGGSLVEKI